MQDQEKLPPSLQFLPPTKKREPDSVLRLTHIESLLLLCTTRWGRDFLRENGTYEIIRITHENEGVDKVRSPIHSNSVCAYLSATQVAEHIERLVNMLKRDEGAETANDAVDGQDDDSEDERIEEV